jgi:CBS domain-containing protein
MGLRESLDEPVSKYASTAFAQVGLDDSVTAAAKAMQKSGSTEALVAKQGAPVGIVTERDILYKVVAAGSDPSRTKVKDVMSSPVQTVEAGSKVSEAIAKMSKLGLRRLGVTKEGKLVGLVTQRALVSGSLRTSVGLPELAVPGEVRCPYCDAVMKDRTELSKHIDQVHLGLGLLEGDSSKW